MPKLPDPVQKKLEEMKEEEQRSIQIKEIKGHYYAYRSTSVWDKEEKKSKTKSEYLGKITRTGEFIEKGTKRRIYETDREIFEYGNCNLAYNFLSDEEPILKDLFPSYYLEILAMAIIRAIDPQPIKLYSSRWEKFYLSKLIEARLSPKYASSIYTALGENQSLWNQFFSRITEKDDFLLYDLTAVFTYSKKISLAEKGYNAHKIYLDQIGTVMAFSTSTTLPVGIEVYHGSLKDITTLKDFRKKHQYSDIGFIMDRGFNDYGFLEELKEDRINFILPLKKDSKYIDLRYLRWEPHEPFTYRDRNIRWCRRIYDLGYVYHFEDPKVRGEEESALLKKVEEDELTMKEFEEKRKNAGIISMITDQDKKGMDIYEMYKGREDVELAFDAMKNTLDSDKTHLQSTEAVRGYFFVTLIALRIYFKILRRLREKDLSQKISVKEVFFELSKMSKIREKNGREYFTKIPKRTRKMLEIFPEAKPTG